MERPPIASCWIKTSGWWLYRHGGKFIVWRNWTTTKTDKKTGVREVEAHDEVIDFEAWTPTDARTTKAKAKISEAIAEMASLSLPA